MKIRNDILDLAKEMLSGSSGLIDDCHKMVKLYNQLSDQEQKEYQDLFVGFIGIESQTDHLPIGNVRKEWNKGSLDKKDTEKIEFEKIFKDQIIKDCQNLLTKLLRKF